MLVKTLNRLGCRRKANQLTHGWLDETYQALVSRRTFETHGLVTARSDAAGNLVFDDGTVIPFLTVVALALGDHSDGR